MLGMLTYNTATDCFGYGCCCHALLWLIESHFLTPCKHAVLMK